LRDVVVPRDESILVGNDVIRARRQRAPVRGKLQELNPHVREGALLGTPLRVIGTG
jgi:hypothetical protein